MAAEVIRGGHTPAALSLQLKDAPRFAVAAGGGESAVAADAPAELRLAAKQTTLTDHDTGAAAELLYGMVRAAEKFA